MPLCCRIRVHYPSHGYTVMSNSLLRSTNLKLGTIGLAWRVMSLPSHWHYTLKGIVSICCGGEAFVRAALNELERWGYLERARLTPKQTANGKFECKYYFHSTSDIDVPQGTANSSDRLDAERRRKNRRNERKLTKNFTSLLNQPLRSKNLSEKALGLLAVAFSLPPDWVYSIDGLAAICKDGRTTIKTALNELERWGYLTVTKLNPDQTETGRFEYLYDFFPESDIDAPAQKIEAQTQDRTSTANDRKSGEEGTDTKAAAAVTPGTEEHGITEKQIKSEERKSPVKLDVFRLSRWWFSTDRKSHPILNKENKRHTEKIKGKVSLIRKIKHTRRRYADRFGDVFRHSVLPGRISARARDSP